MQSSRLPRLRRPLQILMAAGLVSVLAACGGGGGGNAVAPAPAPTQPPTQPPTASGVSGTVVDGYVAGATVVLDINDDRICSVDEPRTETDSKGAFSFDAVQNPSGGAHMVCSSGGVDTSSGQAFVGTLKAPPGASMMTPLTSLVMAELDKELGAPEAGRLSAPTAAAVGNAVAKTAGALNLAGIDLIKVDPASAGADAALLPATAAMQVLLYKTAAAVAAAATGPASVELAQEINDKVLQNAVQAALAAITATPLSGARPLSSLSNEVVRGTVTRAASNPLVLAAAPAVRDLASANVALFAGPLVAQSVAAVAAAPRSVLLAPRILATNPMVMAAESSLTLASDVGLASQLLTVAVAKANPGSSFTAALSGLANALLTSSNITGVAGLINAQISATNAAPNSAFTQYDSAAIAAVIRARANAALAAAQTAAAAAQASGMTLVYGAE